MPNHVKSILRFAAVFLALASNVVRAEVPEQVLSVETNEPLVTTVFNKMLANDSELWAYTRTRDENGEITVERYDPSQPVGTRWSLLLVDGEQPSSKQHKKYAKASDGRADREGPTSFFGHEAADLQSFKLLEENASTALYSFELAPDEEEDEEIMAYVKGELLIDKKTQTVRKMEIKNIAEFSPAFSVNIEEMLVRFSYSEPTSERPAFVTRVEQKTKGTMLGFKSIEEQETIAFSDFAKVQPQLSTE